MATADHELIGTVEVLAVASTADRVLDLEQGTPVTVRGRLSDTDVTGRRLIIDDAMIELVRPEPHAEI